MKLQPALIFGEHMVLQRDKEIKVFGTTAVGDTVTVTLCDETVSAPAEDGVWEVTLSKKNACDKTTMTISSKVTEETIEFKDVAIGEVWLAGGQSNMEFLMKFDYDFEETAKLPDDNKLRYFCYPQTAFKGFLETENNCPNWGFWRKWDDVENRKQFSAVATYAAMILRKKLDVPVGIVACNWEERPRLHGPNAKTWKPTPHLSPYLTGMSRSLKRLTGPST